MAISCIAGWAALGVLLLITEALFVGGFFLSFATSAFLTSFLIRFYPLKFTISLLVFSFLGLVLVYPWKIILRKLHKDQSNVNDY